jgi:uncharacterized protein YjbJ (UPF0337 family)
MNTDVFAGKWKQIRGAAKQRWGELTDDDLKKVEGRLDRFTGVIQERYGYSRDRVESEVAQFLERFKDGRSVSGDGFVDTLQETVSEAPTKVRESAKELPVKARESVAGNRWMLFAGLLVVALALAFLVRWNMESET